MVAHHGERGSGIDHATHDLERFPDLSAAIDEIAHEDHAAIGMRKGPVSFAVSKMTQQSLQGVGLPVDVSDDVKNG
jgi:hypothetical protein